MLFGINLNFIIFSIYFYRLCVCFVLFILIIITATESAVRSAILTICYRLKNTIQIDKVKKVKG